MTEQQVVSRFKHKRPYGLYDILKVCRVPLKFVNEGSFRDVYKIVGLPLIVKIPKDIDGDERDHARNEVRVCRKVMRYPKYESIRQYMPEVLYYGDGVTLMREYAPARNFNKDLIGERIGKVLGIPEWDYNFDNFGRDTNGNIVLLDLGCLTEDYANSAEDLS